MPYCSDLGTLKQHVWCYSPSGFLLRCSCSTSLDSAFFFFLQRSCFLHRRVPLLPIIKTQKSLWSVSNVDRCETGLFPRKTKTSLSGSFFFFQKIFLNLFNFVKQLLRGMRLSQEANTHRLFIKLCWLMDKHAVSADRVVNIDEMSCRLLLVHQTATWSRPSCGATQRKRRHSQSPSAWT